MSTSRISTTSFASVYPHYVTKVEKKGRTRAELDDVTRDRQRTLKVTAAWAP